MVSLALFGRSIWAHMDAVSAEAIAAIELELSQKLIRKFNLELRCLIYDTTNFFTFIDTFNAASELAQRGRNKQLVAAYRGQYDIEDAFKQMKNPNFIAWYPMFHWSAQKIRVHAFYCVIALLLSALVRRTLQAHKKNITFTSAFRAMANIKEVVLVKEQKQTKKLRVIRKLNQMNELEKELYDLFELNKMFSNKS